ncbi:NUDIX hydrolase [Magnetospirillum sp. UT-4]|uniref:NUDIX hydrolase n=1 Tax=Magnetospirillum sp. UT-4 TaxID=2681467 RepID=UPI001381C3FE|nr:NUDIX hydrolase [Magnetospirillum sp. UT-4]CAA7620486.1 Diphosphoinositol polyphosphate phosphohydrolase 3-alpha [Magnetospirillum sp. UT-4]
MPSPKTRLQFAAFPYRVVDGQPMVALVTSRETRRWILPKGQPEKRLKPHQVAEVEAYEEAGLIGRIVERPLCAFPSLKRLRSGREVPTEVVVFLLEVQHELDNWPERRQRQRRWMSPGEAAAVTGEAGLVPVLLEFEALWV